MAIEPVFTVRLFLFTKVLIGENLETILGLAIDFLVESEAPAVPERLVFVESDRFGDCVP